MASTHPSTVAAHAWKGRCAAEAAKHGLRNGDAHPETGRIFYQSCFLTPEAYHRGRVRSAMNNARLRAETLGLPFDLTEAWFEAVWPPNGRCEVLPHIRLEWGSLDRGTSPSIDRIYPDRGYVQTNCRIISNRANTLKNNATAQEMALVLADLRKYDSAH